MQIAEIGWNEKDKCVFVVNKIFLFSSFVGSPYSHWLSSDNVIVW